MTDLVKDIVSLHDLQTIQAKNSKLVLFFWAQWHELSSGQLKEIYYTLAKKYNTIQFYLIEAENVPDISEKFDVSVVPTFLTFQGSTLISKLEGANPQELNKLVKALNDSTSIPNITSTSSSGTELSTADTLLNERLSKLIHTAPVMVFVKGTPSAPRCGFSRQIMDILQKNSIEFGSFDILSDEEVRQGLKTFSDWPTFPQLYVNGSLVGGLDIVKELESIGDLKKELGIKDIVVPPQPPNLEDRLKSLITKSKVMLFMKGSPEAPKCGFSRKISDILKEEGITFSSFDILTDEEVRQGLKTLSDWPTYPQLYVDGKLMGGLDIVNDMRAEGPLKEQLGIQ